MKRYITFMVLLACTFVGAQNIDDVLRYSTDNLQGTARFQGLSGAFGALGGDLSALNINPAGSAVFANSLFTISGTSYNRDNASSYFNGNNGRVTNNLDINQVGGVMVFKTTNPDSKWKKLSLAINYDVVQDLDDEFFVSGNSNQGIDNYFLNFANGVPFGAILLQDGELLENAYLDIGSQQGFTDQQAFLGYFGGIIDPQSSDDDNLDYVSNADYSTVNQEFSRSTTGYNSKFTINAATQYENRLQLGASLNFHNVQYTQLDRFFEDGYDAGSEIQFTTFDNYLRTQGSGFSFSLGAIAKLNEFVRLGTSYQSPTWYRLTDDTSQRINSDLADEDINFINFDVVNLFDTYTIKTPEKWTGSLAIIFGKNGLLSLDYGFQDMSRAELKPVSDTSFATVNDQIVSELASVSSIRIGGEYRIAQVSLRGGYRFEQSPYANGVTIGDLNGFSAGLGYNFGGSRLDLAFNRTEQDFNRQLFDTGFTTPAFINNINTNVTLAYTVNF
ncbi:OmpP1/FadL family transporter [Maribacter halichondriae]|uniref:OmpP1/FadL family transporter n=1 Tax=Maribacter halichondriae TaxID=2980554 RepID=UPI002358DEF8|nr:outer membrane protein transport protein [Maribacter sp. Hal144]